MGTAYGYIYKTTNLINGKIYIGQHKELDFIRKFLKEQGIASDKNHLSANLARAIYYEKYAIKEVML